jgi:drug/metabolite transporter (DMT)-like permease
LTFNKHIETIKAVGAAIFAAIAMSTGPVAAKYALKILDPYTVMLSSSLLAFACLSLILALKGNTTNFITHKKAYLRTAAFFIIVQTIPGIIWFNILPHLQALFAIMIKRTQPVIVLFLSVALRKKQFKIGEILLSFIALGGLFLVLDTSKSNDTITIQLLYAGGAIFCVTLWALQFIYGKIIFSPLTPLEANRTGIGAYALAIIPVTFILGNPEKLLSINLAATGALLYMGVIVFGLGLSAIFYALYRLEPWNVTMILLSGPICGALAAWIILGETVNTRQLIGTTIVILTLAVSLPRNATSSNNSTPSNNQTPSTNATSSTSKKPSNNPKLPEKLRDDDKK